MNGEQPEPADATPPDHQTVSSQKHWRLPLAAVLAVSIVGGATWRIWEHYSATTTTPDCSAVQRVGQRWADLSEASKTGKDTPEDWHALSTDARDTARTMTDTAMRDQTDRWADGFDMLADTKADIKRNRVFDMARDERQSQRGAEAANLIYASASALYKTCEISTDPNGAPS